MGPLEIARIVFALIAVLGLIGALALAAKRAGLGGLASARGKRLKLVESLAIDQRRRAAIIACDGREHLIILDANSATVIESAIPALQIEEPSPDVAAHPAHRPVLAATPGIIRLFRRDEERAVGAFRTAGAL